MKSVFYFLLATLLTGAVSAAELVPDRSVRLMIVNGKETKYDTEPTAFEPGFTQIAIKVFMSIGHGGDSTSFESDPFLLMFEAGDQDISIVAPRFRDYDKAERHFKGQPDIKLVSNGKELEYRYVKLKGKEGFFPFSDLGQIVAKYNQGHSIPFGIQTELKAVPDMCEGVLNIEQLKIGYQKVSVADQKAFKRWLAGQK